MPNVKKKLKTTKSQERKNKIKQSKKREKKMEEVTKFLFKKKMKEQKTVKKSESQSQILNKELFFNPTPFNKKNLNI